MTSTFRSVGAALRALLVFTLLLGVGYPLLVTGIGQLALPAQANGSRLLDADGVVVGSALIGQSFSDEEGAALPGYFASRPSAAGDGYDAGASSASNLGPENPDLVAAISQRRAAIAEREGVDPAAIPADALTASSSGLDPHISDEYALLQIPRVAAERDLAEADVEELVRSSIAADGGFLGGPVVNGLRLNLALDSAS